MGRVFGGIARSSDVTENLAPADLVPLPEAVGITVEMGVVIRELLPGVELIDGQAARLAVEKFGDGAILHGEHRGPGWRQDIDRFVLALTASGVGVGPDQLFR